jgi:hypothetical protein
LPIFRKQDRQQQYGVLETIEKIRDEDNACSRAPKKPVQVLKKPGASPLLFGKFLMSTTAFLALEDIADNLPPYTESVLSCHMGAGLQKAYEDLEKALRDAMAEHRGIIRTASMRSGREGSIHPRRSSTKFLVARPKELDRNAVYAKETALIEDIREELRQGRRSQVYASFTGEKDVNARLEHVLSAAGFRVAVLRSLVPTQKREEWYDRQFAAGVEVVVCHPKLCETGLDLVALPTLYFHQTGYSLHTLRQASRRSWRIGQKHPVRVKFLTYKGTMQEVCLRLMGKKMLVALMMEGKFSGEGLQSLDADEDLMSAMARELVEKAGVGESADAIWRQLDRERTKHTATVPTFDDGPHDIKPAPEPVVQTEPALEASIHLVHSGSRKKRKNAPPWPTTTTTDGSIQLSLFG